MHLWAVVYLMGKVAATFGPLDPGIDLNQCMVAARDQEQDWDLNWIKKDLAHNPVVLDGHRLSRGDLRITCIYAKERPE